MDRKGGEDCVKSGGCVVSVREGVRGSGLLWAKGLVMMKLRL